MDQPKAQKPWYKVWWKIIPFVLFCYVTVPVYALWRIWKHPKWGMPVKALSSLGVVILTGLVWSGMGSQPSTSPATPTTTVQSGPKELTPEQVAEDKEKVKVAYKQVIELGKVGDGAFGEVQKAMASGNSATTYFLATDAIRILNGISDKIKETGDNLSLNDKTNEAKFKEGTKILSEAYDWKRWGLDKLQKGIDDDSLKLMQEATDYFTSSGQKMILGLAKIAEVLVAYDMTDIMGETK